ncbi:hypothetical protein C2G38_2076834, partial [Gigaspora rosea]
MIIAGGLHIKLLSSFQQKTRKAYEYSTQITCESANIIRTVATLTCENKLWKDITIYWMSPCAKHIIY